MSTDSPFGNDSDGQNDYTSEVELPRVLFVDNFDSFTYNLVEYVEEALRARQSAEGADGTDGSEVGE